jgi:predicted RNA-binding protein with PIN domain
MVGRNQTELTDRISNLIFQAIQIMNSLFYFKPVSKKKLNMKTYIIDGNNVIGKDHRLKSLHKQDKIGAREKLTFAIERFAHKGKDYIYLHFDGYENKKLRGVNVNIVYSEIKTADEKMKMQIDLSKNKKNLIIVSSDRSVMNYGKLNSCKVISSEDFLQGYLSNTKENKEEVYKDGKKFDVDEFKKLFGLDE